MQNQIPNILSWFNTNQGLAQWVTASIAVIALIYAVKEFFLKRRPYIDIEVQYAKNPDKTTGGWLFFALLLNKGTYPGIVKVEKTKMRVGDEVYPSTVKNKLIISPGESRKSALIGSIYDKGIKKILGHEYRLNRVEIEVIVKSCEIGSDNFKYKTKVIYEINVSGEKPEFFLVEEEFK